MALTREDHLENLARLLVFLGFIDDVEMARNTTLVDLRLRQAFRNPGARLNPYCTIGHRIRFYREKKLPSLLGKDRVSRDELVKLANEHLSEVGDQGIADQSALARIEAGEQRLTMLQAMAIARVFGVSCEVFSPWDFNPHFLIPDLRAELDPHGD